MMFKGGKNFESTCGQYTYRFGIIDFVTKHSFKKSVETYAKSTLYRVNSLEISAQSPDVY
jgi:hypothetical protein